MPSVFTRKPGKGFISVRGWGTIHSILSGIRRPMEHGLKMNALFSSLNIRRVIIRGLLLIGLAQAFHNASGAEWQWSVPMGRGRAFLWNIDSAPRENACDGQCRGLAAWHSRKGENRATGHP
jgi:hypothetical protein